MGLTGKRAPPSTGQHFVHLPIPLLNSLAMLCLTFCNPWCWWWMGVGVQYTVLRPRALCKLRWFLQQSSSPSLVHSLANNIEFRSIIRSLLGEEQEEEEWVGGHWTQMWSMVYWGWTTTAVLCHPTCAVLCSGCARNMV